MLVDIPQHMLNYFARKGFNLDITPEDDAILASGCVDFIGFSYYMSFTTQFSPDNPQLDYVEPRDLVSNPYIDTSEWGILKMIRQGYVIHSTGSGIISSCRCLLSKMDLVQLTNKLTAR